MAEARRACSFPLTTIDSNSWCTATGWARRSKKNDAWGHAPQPADSAATAHARALDRSRGARDPPRDGPISERLEISDQPHPRVSGWAGPAVVRAVTCVVQRGRGGSALLLAQGEHPSGPAASHPHGGLDPAAAQAHSGSVRRPFRHGSCQVLPSEQLAGPRLASMPVPAHSPPAPCRSVRGLACRAPH